MGIEFVVVLVWFAHVCGSLLTDFVNSI
jgi:hypothetical protein